MRPSSLIMVLLVAASCTVRGPQRVPVPVAISIKGRVHVPAQAHVQGQIEPHGEVQGQVQTHGEVRGQVQTQGQVSAHVDASPPPPPVLVAVQNAPVVEFFGIPLEGAQDVVFVLDCSGSMVDYARGRLAEIAVAPPQPPDTAAADPAEPGADGAPPPDPATPPDDPAAATSPAPAAEPAAPPRPRKIDVARFELVDALERLPLGTRLNVVFFNNTLEAFAPRMVPLDDAGRTNLVSLVREIEPDGRTALAPAMRAAFLMNANRIVLLSDGLGNVGGDDASLLRDAREAMRGGVRIDTVGVGSDQDVTLLRTLAAESGGLYQGL